MMTTPTGNIFRVTGPLWGESTGHRWDGQRFDAFFDLHLKKTWLNKQSRHLWFEMPSRSLWRHCNDVMSYDHRSTPFSATLFKNVIINSIKVFSMFCLNILKCSLMVPIPWLKTHLHPYLINPFRPGDKYTSVDLVIICLANGLSSFWRPFIWTSGDSPLTGQLGMLWNLKNIHIFPLMPHSTGLRSVPDHADPCLSGDLRSSVNNRH